MHGPMPNPLTKLSESTEEDEVLRSRKRKLDMEAESDGEQLREQLRLHLEDKRILNGDVGKRLRRDFGRLLKSGEEGVPMADIDYEIYKYINELADQYIELDDLLEQNGVSYSEALEQAAQFRKQFLCLLEKHAVRNQDLVVICWDLMERIEQQPEHPDSIEGLNGNVQFEHVEFGYNPDKIIVHDFSADVHDGQKIAIVGPTGAGKTTMVKLLMRFYDVNKGAIKVDGHDVRNFNRSELHEMFGMVLQDTWLFSGTIMENIRYGRLDATDEEVIAAAKAAHIHNFIMQQPGGYQMVLDEETSNISQGQKQLLTIARAILADNKILILDEATSSVDTRTEMQIQKAMDNLMKGRTSFVIAHRLSTIKNADMILVMKDGDIIEQGDHAELLAKGGFYADLYNSQFSE